ncbi:MAG TPA: L,D-transpeptidase, partial [Verrucomicrobiae bacterium]|nr:L,D-transpeptidase [Verrucomicrobiae bacterium]
MEKRQGTGERGFLVLAAAVLLTAGTYGRSSAASPRSLCGIPHPSDSRIEWRCEKRAAKKTPQQLWGERWIDVLRFNRLDRVHFHEVNSLKVPVDPTALAGFTPMPLLYPPAEKEEKYILIDQTEQFLGAYAFGRLVFSTPITTGTVGSRTPTGIFRITAFDRDHRSTDYPLEGSGEPYPMRHGLMFHQDERRMQYWIHGRDMPGYPGSHGCIGLYDEQMTHNYLGEPSRAV